MACACKVTEEINRIQKYYSYNGKDRGNNKPKMTVNKKEAAITIGIYLLLLPLTPLIFIGLLIFSIFSRDKKISMRKFFNFIQKTRNGAKQQII